MKAKFFYSLALMLGFNYYGFSQTNSAPAGNNPALKEAAMKAHQKIIERKRQSKATSVPVDTKYVGQLDENDKYMGKQQEYLNMITLNEIPSDFPQYQKGWTFVEYDNKVEKYFKDHKDIIKEAYKAKF